MWESAKNLLKGPPIRIDSTQAKLLLDQFHETAAYRQWKLRAVSIMRNHVHMVVTAPGNPPPSKLLQDFKAYGSRALNRIYGKPSCGTWWTESGSKRKLDHEEPGIIYVCEKQPHPLVVYRESCNHLASGGRQSPEPERIRQNQR